MAGSLRKHGRRGGLIFHNQLGIAKKEARLNYLSNYWISALDSNVEHTFAYYDKAQIKGICSIHFPNKNVSSLCSILRKKYQINTKLVRINQKTYLRVSSNTFTTETDLDHFVDKLQTVLKEI